MIEITEELFQRIKAPIIYQGPGPVKFGRGVHGSENTLVTIHSNRSVDVVDLEAKKEQDDEKIVEITDAMFKRTVVYKGPGPVSYGRGMHGSKHTTVTVYAKGSVNVEGVDREEDYDYDDIVKITDDMFKQTIVYKGPGPVKISRDIGPRIGLHGSKNTTVTVYANGDVQVTGLDREVGKNENVVIQGGVVGLRITNRR
jgi:hypothetical protein